MNKFLYTAVTALILLFNLNAAMALPTNQSFAAEAALADAYFATDYNFTGIVSLSNCSGSLVRFEQSRDSDFAMVLSNGHCVSPMPTPNTYVANRADSRSFGVLDSNGKNLGRVRSTKVIYATMTGTDMSLFQLDKTYAEIKAAYNVEPLTFASRKPAVNDPIEIVSGYWKRGYSCQIEKFVHQLKEADWTMEDSIRYSRPGCNTIGGTSGSPIILAGTRTVIGVNNTGNESGGRCTMNNPCEVDENGNVEAHEGFSYGQQTYWLYSCLNSSLELDLQKEGCRLYH